jgi:cytochrome c
VPEGAEIGAATGTATATAAATGGHDSDPGARLFRKCGACHAITADGVNKAGPSLYGLFGRRAGTVPGYPYSEALRSSGLVWTEESVDALIDLGPERLTPGSKMPLQRMPDPQDRAELIRYLKRATNPAGGG